MVSEREAAAILVAGAKESPNAAAELNVDGKWKERLGRPSAARTDCPEGCSTGLNDVCPHGWRSAARTMYLLETRNTA